MYTIFLYDDTLDFNTFNSIAFDILFYNPLVFAVELHSSDNDLLVGVLCRDDI